MPRYKVPTNFQLLEAERVRRELTIEQTALLAGVSYWRALNTLKGRNADPVTVRKLAKLLKVPLRRVQPMVPVSL